jgi:hypothetical protein
MKLDRRAFLAATSCLATPWSWPAIGATELVFDDGFENGIDPDLYSLSTGGTGTLEADGTRSREGGRSLHSRFVRSGTVNYRQEVSLKRIADSARNSPAQGSPYYWLGVSVYIPSSWSTSHSVVLQWHTVEDNSGASPVIGIRIIDNQWKMTSWRAGGKSFGNVIKDQWTDWVFRILWRNNATGAVRIWKNGVMVNDQTNVQTTWEGENMVPFFKLGGYNAGWKYTSDSDPDGSVHEAWHDAIRLAFDNSATYEDVAPRGGPAAPMPPHALGVS